MSRLSIHTPSCIAVFLNLKYELTSVEEGSVQHTCRYLDLQQLTPAWILIPVFQQLALLVFVGLLGLCFCFVLLKQNKHLTMCVNGTFIRMNLVRADRLLLRVGR